MTALQSVSSPMILMPAYGRTYATVQAMLADWDAGKDFRIVGHGCYCSVRDLDILRNESSSITLLEPRGNLSVRV